MLLREISSPTPFCDRRKCRLLLIVILITIRGASRSEIDIIYIGICAHCAEIRNICIRFCGYAYRAAITFHGRLIVCQRPHPPLGSSRGRRGRHDPSVPSFAFGNFMITLMRYYPEQRFAKRLRSSPVRIRGSACGPYVVVGQIVYRNDPLLNRIARGGHRVAMPARLV